MCKGIVIYCTCKNQYVVHTLPQSGPLRVALIEHLSCNRPPVVSTTFLLGHNCNEGRRKPLNTPYLLVSWWLESQICCRTSLKIGKSKS